MTQTENGEATAFDKARHRRKYRMATWQDLIAELNSWSTAGKTATFWWRDDDAIAPTPQLDRLLQRAKRVPLALAVIPGAAKRELADRLRYVPSVVVMQHGWTHTDHASGQRNEYPASRSRTDVARELSEGRCLLNSYFGDQLVPAFVPPWNNFADSFLPLLTKSGNAFISRKGPRPKRLVADGIIEVNAHVAPIRWTKPPSFGENEDYLAPLVDHLQGRRTGRYDSAEPTGLLTHHLAQNDQSYEFISRLVALISEHPTAKWLAGTDIFQPEGQRT